MKTSKLLLIFITAFTLLIITGSCATVPRTQEEREGAHQEALFQAVKKYDYVEVKRLIEAGVDVNARDKKGYTALIWASAWKQTEIVRLLIEAGADVHAQGDRDRRTALMHASASGDEYIEMVKLLLEAGADVNTQDELGFTALIWASQWGHTAVVKLLIEEGADINIVNNDGKSALWIAKKRRYTQIEHMLLTAGAKK